jgi:predicted transcriptional regulator
MAVDNQNDEFRIPGTYDDTQDIESLEDLISSTTELIKDQRSKRVQVMCYIYKLTRANVTIPTSVKEIIEATNLSEIEVIGIVTYLLETGFVGCETNLDLDVSFYITSRGITQLESDTLDQMSKHE